MEDREQTPPHYPTYGIYLSDEEITDISRVCLPPPSHSYKITILPHGQSYNNRIYFIKDTIDNEKSYVLKVGGKNFGSEKFENEIACLQILKRFCPTVPVAEVVAWSLDGRKIVLANSEKQGSGLDTDEVNTQCQQAWILMTCLPGEAMDPTKLSVEDMSTLSLQVAQMIANWRSAVPRSDHCGNLRFRVEDSSRHTPSWQKGGVKIDLGFDIEGVIDINLIHTNEPLESTLSYWKAKIVDAMKQLSEQATYTPNRDSLLPLLEHFNNKTLANVAIVRGDPKEKGGFIFSHTDLSPRNVLISGSPPQVTGIVDFEFSGFFPITRDFTVKSIVSEKEDEEGWPVGMHEQILQFLEDRGMETLLRWRGSSEWEQLMNLIKLETYIAPWWLGTDIQDPVELKKGLEDARRSVQDAVAALTRDV